MEVGEEIYKVVNKSLSFFLFFDSFAKVKQSVIFMHLYILCKKCIQDNV